METLRPMVYSWDRLHNMILDGIQRLIQFRDRLDSCTYDCLLLEQSIFPRAPALTPAILFFVILLGIKAALYHVHYNSMQCYFIFTK